MRTHSPSVSWPRSVAVNQSQSAGAIKALGGIILPALLTLLLSAWQVRAIGFSDGFEGYAAGSLESNDGSGPNAGADGGANPWFGVPASLTPPSFVVVTNEHGVSPHSGTNMIRGHNFNALYNNDQDWYNLSFRCATGGVYYGNIALEWWFYDPIGVSGASYGYDEYVALCNYTPVPPDTDYDGSAWPAYAAGGQRMSLGAYNDGVSAFDTSKYQARIVGATDGISGVPEWFNLSLARSVGWHHARIVLDTPVANVANARFYVDDMTTPQLTHSTVEASGFNLIEINGDLGNTTGYFDDFAFQDNVAAPAFTTGPTNLIVETGASAVFRVSGATGSPAPLYFWQKNNAPLSNGGRISGADTATLTITGCSAADTATYSCLVSNIAGVAVGTATLNVLIPPTIDSQSPVGGTFSAASGDTVNLSVTAHASNPINYQWNKNSSPLSNGGHISGATNATLSIANFAAGDAGTYYCHLSNADGATDSTNVILALAVGPTINIQPTNQTVALGSTASFTVNAAGPSLAYQWKKNSTPLSNGGRIAGATSSTLSISSVIDADASTSYVCTVTNSGGHVDTLPATLTVIDPPVITTQPVSQVASNGSTVVFHVVASGTSPSYQWKKGGAALSNSGDFSGVTTANLTVHVTSLADVGIYTVTVTNLAGSPTSSGAALRVNQAATTFFDDFESYPYDKDYIAYGRYYGTALDQNYGDFPASPYWGQAPPNICVYASGQDGVNAYSGNQMVGAAYGYVTSGDNDESFLNLAYRFNSGQLYYGNIMLDWYFSDPGTADAGDQLTLANFASGLPSTQDANASYIIPSSPVQNLFIGTWPNLDTTKYQVAVMGASDGTAGRLSKNIAGTTMYFDTAVARSAGWHHARIVVGPADPGTRVATAQFFIDDMSNAAFSHVLPSGSVGFNAIHMLGASVFSPATSETSGFFDDLTFQAANDPYIVQQPVSVTNDFGSNVTFTVVAMATSYQWQKNGDAIDGATNAVLPLNSISLRDAGTYTCVVTGANGSVTSSAATLTVNGSPPYITSIVRSGVNYVINFVGSASDPASAFKVLSGSVVTAVTTTNGSAVITGSGGVYQATVPASGPRQFYRIQR